MTVTLTGDPSTPCPLILSCEHAGNLVPPPVRPSAADRRWLETHWGYDPGALATAQELARLTGSALCAANFSRLLCDTNRPWGDPSCVLTTIEGQPLAMNSGLDAAELDRRRQTLYEPYHRTLAAAVAARARRPEPVLLLAVHSFTPVLGEERRAMELGVLFDDHQPLAERLARSLTAADYATALNEPYSGKQGLIFSAARHGEDHDLPYLEIEIRQDLLAGSAQVAQHAARILAALRQLLATLPPRR